MSHYSSIPDFYCDLCRGDIWKSQKNHIFVDDEDGEVKFAVHKRCLGPAIALVIAIKGVVRERI